MTEKYLLFSLDDEKSKRLGEVISNNSCKKIVNFLAEREASASDISKELGMPLNSVEYSLDKLVSAGMIEKTKGFFWSSKGKKIDKYKVANKLIVISPKKGNVYSKLKGIVPVILISAVLMFFVKAFYGVQYGAMKASERVADSSGEILAAGSNVASVAPKAYGACIQGVSYSNLWAWFGLGALVVIISFLIWNWKKL